MRLNRLLLKKPISINYSSKEIKITLTLIGIVCMMKNSIPNIFIYFYLEDWSVKYLYCFFFVYFINIYSSFI